MKTEVTRTIDGDSEMLSYTDAQGNFCALIQPRMSTKEEIDAAFRRIPGAIVGNWSGVTFTNKRHKK